MRGSSTTSSSSTCPRRSRSASTRWPAPARASAISRTSPARVPGTTRPRRKRRTRTTSSACRSSCSAASRSGGTIGCRCSRSGSRRRVCADEQQARHGRNERALRQRAASRRRAKMKAEEIKDELVETARELLRCGLVEGTAGNLSARLPDGNVVLSPSSLPYETMTTDDLVVTDLDGKVVEGKRPPTSEKALHLACLRKHPELGAVIHSHAKYATMFAI